MAGPRLAHLKTPLLACGILACPKRDWFDHHLSEADKKTLSFGTIFTEQLLCKVGLWKRRMQSMAKVDLSARAQELFEEAQPWIKGENFQTHTKWPIPSCISFDISVFHGIGEKGGKGLDIDASVNMDVDV
ncbi:hypothetical protein B0H14DRAFT_2571748 [Mycena olivaceomarginata]|nr:hypothetical protein B0H14DRAFT_2571748 [Mycena olivaceomarginata]